MTFLGAQCNECQGKQDKCWWPKTPVRLPMKISFLRCSLPAWCFQCQPQCPDALPGSLSTSWLSGHHCGMPFHLAKKNIEKYYDRDFLKVSWFPITVLEIQFCEVDPRKSKIISWCWTKNEKDNDSGSGIPVWPTRCCEVSAANSTSSLPQKTSALNHPLFWISYQQGGTIIADCLQKWPMNFFGPKKDQKGLSMDSEQKCCLLTKDTWFLPPKVAK